MGDFLNYTSLGPVIKNSLLYCFILGLAGNSFCEHPWSFISSSSSSSCLHFHPCFARAHSSQSMLWEHQGGNKGDWYRTHQQVHDGVGHGAWQLLKDHLFCEQGAEGHHDSTSHTWCPQFYAYDSLLVVINGENIGTFVHQITNKKVLLFAES